jgi:hypothetical protein
MKNQFFTNKLNFEVEEIKENKKINVFTKLILRKLIKDKIKYAELYVKDLDRYFAK